VAERHCLFRDCPQPVSVGEFRFCPECGHSLRLRDRYVTHRLLGQGGFGRTVVASDWDRPSHPLCVVKQFLPQDPSPALVLKARELFAREAQLLEQLGSHPQIPQLHAYFEEQGVPYLVQEYVAGSHLGAVLAREGPFSAAAVLGVLRGIIPVLAFVHGRGVLHRDVKPENIMRRAEDGVLVLVDFGAGKDAATPEAIATRIGTPHFAAPEQLLGQPLPASDLYGLGVTCMHLWTGREPAQLFDVYRGEWAWRDAVPGGVDGRLGQILDRLVQGPLQRRYASAAEVATDMLSVSPVAAAPSGPGAAPPQRDDYGQLATLMDGDLWREADRLTWDILCRAAGKVTGSYLFGADVATIPCDVWLRLDWLWRSHSAQRFGWSVRREIFQSLGRDYGQLCWHIGWRQHNSAGRPLWLSGEQLTYDRAAPPGHLPWIGGFYGHDGACGEQELTHLLCDRLAYCLSQEGARRP